MFIRKIFYGVLAAGFALSLVGADLAEAQCGRGQGGGRGVCMRTDQPQPCPNYQGQGRKGGQGRQQRLRDGSWVNPPATQSPDTVTPPAPTTTN